MKIILKSDKLPAINDEDLRLRIDSLLAPGYYIAVYVEVRDGERYLTRAQLSEADFQIANAANKRPIDYFTGMDVPALIAEFEDFHALGQLSLKYESNGNTTIHGYDQVGGHSYGAYQLSTKKGSLSSFLTFLASAQPELSQTLLNAGGSAAASAGDEKFIAAWESLTINHNALFFRLQHAFIKKTHYDPFIATVKSQLKLDISKRSLALKNVAWSTAVQHGVGNSVFKTALQGADLSNDADIINKIYAERSRVNYYFNGSSPNVQEALKNRFIAERGDALAML